MKNKLIASLCLLALSAIFLFGCTAAGKIGTFQDKVINNRVDSLEKDLIGLKNDVDRLAKKIQSRDKTPMIISGKAKGEVIGETRLKGNTKGVVVAE